MLSVSSTTGIVFQSYSPLGSPASFEAGEVPRILEDPVIKDIALKHQATVAQVMVVLEVDVPIGLKSSCPLSCPDLHSLPASPRTSGDPKVCKSRQD